MPVDPTVAHLTAHLRAVAARYPHAWDALADYREHRRELGDWPRWCYCPLAGAFAIVTGGRDVARQPITLHETSAVAIVGALGAWRATQGIYRLDAALLDALWETPIEGDLPVDLLHRLPEWCVYVETPHRGSEGLEMPGFFAHLEHDTNDGRTELRILRDLVGLDGAPLLAPIVLHLGHGSLSACLAAAVDEIERQARARGAWDDAARRAADSVRAGARDLVAPLVSLLLYLCSEAAEIRDARGTDRLPRYQQPVSTKHGARWIPAPAPTTWEVGWRIGAALRAAATTETSPGHAGLHASPRGHLRRAHWHTYITGPRSDVSRQRRELRWLHPMLVGTGDLVPTIHPVEPTP